MFTKIVSVLSIVCVSFMIGCGVQEESPPNEPPNSIIIITKDDIPDVDPITGEPPPPEPVVPEPVDGILERGSRIKVTNTIVDDVDKRLRIRNPAGIESPIVGSAADGATGTILGGPAFGDGWKWWEIAWDNNGKVAFNEGKDCCIGWSAETSLDRNFRYLTEIE